MTAAWLLTAAGCVLVGLAAGCATPPKPTELDALERLRAGPDAPLVHRRVPALLEAVDGRIGHARAAWLDGELETSRLDALTGIAKYKTALAVAEQDEAKAGLEQVEAELARVGLATAEVVRELQATQDQLALLDRVGGMHAAEEARATLAAAELALKDADIVDARSHAPRDYDSARTLLAEAAGVLRGGDREGAIARADMARRRATQAALVARPLFERARRAQLHEALLHDAASVPGLTIRLDRRGDVRRLVIPLHDLFSRGALSAKRAPALESVAELLRRHSTYDAQVIGHTDLRGRPDRLRLQSETAARSVLDALVARGVEPRRLRAAGVGPDEPASDSSRRDGRKRNERVEVVILY